MAKFKRSENIGVMGGGPVGVSFARQLAEIKDPSSSLLWREIDLYEAGSRVGPGGPFGPGTASWINNQKASQMGVTLQDPGEYAREIAAGVYQDEFPEIDFQSGGEFYPREMFGEHLASQALKMSQPNCAPGPSVDQINLLTKRHIIKVNRNTAGEFILEDSTGKMSKPYQRVILAIGTPCSDKYLDLRGHPAYEHQPTWNKICSRKYASDGPIVLLGTSQTSADLAIAIKELGYQGEIIMTSRSGEIPMVTAPSASSPFCLKYLTIAQLEQLIDPTTGYLPLNQFFPLLQNEIWGATGVIAPLTALRESEISPAQSLEFGLSAAKVPLIHQEVLRSARFSFEFAWRHLSEADQKKVKKYDATFSRYRYPIAPPTAEKLLGYMQRGEVRIAKGLIPDSVRPDGQRIILECQHEILYSHDVLNATGPGSDFMKLAEKGAISGVIPQLLQTGMVTPHHAGGLRFDHETFEAIDANNQPVHGLHLLGHAQKGQLFLVSAMDKLVYLAHQLASAIALG